MSGLANPTGASQRWRRGKRIALVLVLTPTLSVIGYCGMVATILVLSEYYPLRLSTGAWVVILGAWQLGVTIALTLALAVSALFDSAGFRVYAAVGAAIGVLSFISLISEPGFADVSWYPLLEFGLIGLCLGRVLSPDAKNSARAA